MLRRKGWKQICREASQLDQAPFPPPSSEVTETVLLSKKHPLMFYGTSEEASTNQDLRNGSIKAAKGLYPFVSSTRSKW